MFFELIFNAICTANIANYLTTLDNKVFLNDLKFALKMQALKVVHTYVTIIDGVRKVDNG